ncbi:PDDEXK nuclease domain-containing protein [Prevotellamassilia timonensis]|uniref:PDDEXK nuclease domain-containing protein n=1 Tax=Prevotellamassilia timonensis TaxID=1852370 RepID=UPI003078ACFF
MSKLDIWANGLNMPTYTNTGNLLTDARQIIDESRKTAYRAINVVMLQRNWLLGKRIQEEILLGKDRADYGAEVIKNLSKALTEIYGKGFNKNNLYGFVSFYKIFPTVSGKSEMLSWSHYLLLINVKDDEARRWYAHEAYTETWSVRTLRRNIASQYYYRLLQSQDKKAVADEMYSLTTTMQGDKLEFVKNPMVVEFLGLSPNTDFTESRLETSIITHLQHFIMELGKGYAFVARQQHIHTDMGDFYIDLVFYNYILKCFMLIDLKTTQISHQDVGQMDMYVRMYDSLKRTEGDNPTIGLILCSETSADMARYSILKENKQLFQAKYLTFLPTEEQLRQEIEQQKEIFLMQREMNKKKNDEDDE